MKRSLLIYGTALLLLYLCGAFQRLPCKSAGHEGLLSSDAIGCRN